jgi:hypothetical protein
MMRHILTAAAAIAVSGVFALTAARAETPYQAGGPAQIGTTCKVVTDGDEMHGYYTECPKAAPAVRQVKKKSNKS